MLCWGEGLHDFTWSGTEVASCLCATPHLLHEPTSFDLDVSILTLTEVLIVGSGSQEGPRVCAIVVVGLPEILGAVDLSSNILGPARTARYVFLLVMVAMFRSQAPVLESTRRYTMPKGLGLEALDVGEG